MSLRRPHSRHLAFTVAFGLSGCGASDAPVRAPASEAPTLAARRAATADRGASPPAATPALLVESDGSWPWPIATPENAGLRRDALARLVDSAERTGTDGLLILHHGSVVVARRFGKPRERLELMSVTKGFVGIAIGWLLEEGKIPSLDTPLSRWFPEWKTGKHARVTLRHVVTHTSGLAHRAAGGELAKQRDRLAYVRGLTIETEPGEVFSYNNEATQLLSGVIAAAAREPLDVFLEKKLFTPLGASFGWRHDAAGNVLASEGLSLSMEDLAKLGVALAEQGTWKGTRVVPASWLAAMLEPVKKAPWHGALTWLLTDGPWQVQSAERRARLGDAGFAAAAKLAALDGKRFSSRAAYWMEAGALLSASERQQLSRSIRDDLLPFGQVEGRLVGFDFNGWLGQYLVVYPQARIVAVRQRREPPAVTDQDNDRIGMRGFTEMLRAALPDDLPPAR